MGLSLSQVRRADALTIALVTAVTLVADLAVAVITGIVFSALWFAWSSGGTLRIEPSFEPVPPVDRACSEEADTKGSGDGGEEGGRARRARKVYTIHGQLFFGSTTPFLEAFDAASDPKVVVLRFGPNAAVADFSGLEALNVLTKRYERFEKTLKIERLVDASSQRMLRKAGNLLVGEVNQALEPMETDQLIPTGLCGINVQEGHFTGAIRM